MSVTRTVSFFAAVAVAGALMGAATNAPAKTVATQDTHRIHIGGKVLAITEGNHHAGGTKAKITFAGKPVGDYKQQRVRLYGKFDLNGAKVIVLQVWNGGLSCHGYLQVLHVQEGKLKVSKLLGKCHQGTADVVGDKLYLRFKVYSSADRYKVETRYVFEDGQLIRIG